MWITIYFVLSWIILALALAVTLRPILNYLFYVWAKKRKTKAKPLTQPHASHAKPKNNEQR